MLTHNLILVLPDAGSEDQPPSGHLQIGVTSFVSSTPALDPMVGLESLSIAQPPVGNDRPLKRCASSDLINNRGKRIAPGKHAFGISIVLTHAVTKHVTFPN